MPFIYLFSFGYKLKSLLSYNFLSNQTEPMKKITKIQQIQKPMKHPQPNLAPKKRLQWLSKKSNQQNSWVKDSEMNENKIVILTVLLLCSAPMAKPKAMMSKMKTEINTNLEAMDMQLQQIQNSTTTRSTSALCSLLFFFFLLVLTRSFSASISNIQKFTGKVWKKKPMCFFYFNRK